MNMKTAAIKTYFGLSSIFAPAKTANKSFDIFQKVRKKDVRDREKSFYDQARSFTVAHNKEPLDCFELGDPFGPLLFLVHGWDSNAGSMSYLAERFVNEGYRVIAFNLPGHAFYKSSKTNLVECAGAMKAVLEHVNPSDRFSVVSHSFGSAVVANALSQTNYKVDRLVFLTNPNRMEDIFKEFKRAIGLSSSAYKALIKKTQNILGDSLSALDVTHNLQQIDFNNLLLIHDINDKVLPHKASWQINSTIQNAQLISMESIGHYKMLWNDEVIGRTAAFIKGQEVY